MTDDHDDYPASGEEMSEHDWIADLKAHDGDGVAAAAEAMQIHYQALGSPHPISDDLWRKLAAIALDF